MRKLTFIVLTTILLACESNTPPTEKVERPTKSALNDSTTRVLYKEYKVGKELFSQSQIYELGKLNPVDEAQIDTVFFVFREKLLDAVQKKDIFYLLEQLAPNIQSSFGGEQGIDEFTKFWDLSSEESTATSPLWAELERTLTLGGIFDKKNGMFLSNYVYATLGGDYDPFTHSVIVGSGVRYRSKPSLNSPIAGKLSYDIVKVLNSDGPLEKIGDEAYPWVEIETLNGQKGFIYGKYVVSPIDYRAGFQKINGNWKMVFFVEGD